MRPPSSCLLIALLVLCSACTDRQDSPVGEETSHGGEAMSFRVRCPAFGDEGRIPARFTSEGLDISPEIAWSELPDDAKTLALIVDDPDAPDPKAPKMTWVHWVLYDVPTHAHGLPEAVADDALPSGTRQGKNDWERTGYGGPSPPIGRHRYVFKLYALDTTLGDLGTPTKAELLKAMEGHVVGETTCIGTYQKGDG